MKAGNCKHYNGLLHECCNAGVNYYELAGREPGVAWRLPCNPSMKPPKRVTASNAVTCNKFEPITSAEIAEDEKLFEESLARFSKCQPLIERIKTQNKGRNASGEDDCPCCGKKVKWSIAGSNGHIMMSCETEDCIAFME